MSLASFRCRIAQSRSRADDSLGSVLLSLGADSMQYLVGLAVVGLGNMVLVPLYGHYLAPEEFGIFGLLEVLVLASVAVAGLGFNLSYAKWYADVGPSNIPRLLSTQLLVGAIAALSAGLVVALSFYSSRVQRFLGSNVEQYAQALLVIIMCECIQGLLLNHLRSARRPISFTIGSIARLAAITIATVWLMAYQDLGLTGLFWGRALGDIVSIAVLAFLSRTDLSWDFSREYAAGMLQYGFPLVWSSLLIMLLDGSGRFFLSHYGDLHQVGIYSMGSKIAALMRLVLVMPFGVAWGGMMYQIAKLPNAQLIYSKLAGYILVLSFGMVLVFSLMTPTLFRVFATPAYAGAVPILPLLLLVQGVTVLQYPVAVGLHLRGATRLLIPISLAALAVNFFFSWALVPRYGAYGAATAWLAGWGSMVMLIGLTGQRRYPLSYELKPLVFGLAMAGLAIATRWLVLPSLARWHFLTQVSSASAVIFLVGAYFISDFRQATRREECDPGT